MTEPLPMMGWSVWQPSLPWIAFAGADVYSLVTGRELPDLQNVCPALEKFEWVVAENGALLYRPADHFSQLLCAAASSQLAQKLAEAQVEPLSMGRAIIATREP